MAKINPVKLKQDADKLEKAGRLDQAIALYKQIVEDNPRDWNTINKIGDLFAKQNKNREASDEYAKVADFYAKDGFLLKAIALWKKINRLDTTALEPYLNLADLYAKQGLMMEAKSQYQFVVDEFIKRGKMRDAGEVLKKMAEIDPGDLKVRSKLADLYTREGNGVRAVEEHIAIADELNRKGHLAEALQVLEKGLKIDPKSNRLRLELARIHLVQKSYEKAAHYLEEAAKSAPKDTPILARLGEAYLGAKKLEEAEAIFKRLLELDPDDVENRIQMGRVYILQKQFDRAYDEFVPAIETLVARKEAEKAASILQQITQKDPGHIKALLKLVDVYRVLRNESLVAATYSELTEAYIQAGQMDQAGNVLEMLVDMDPQNQQHKSKLEFVRSRGSGAPSRPTPKADTAILEEEF
ncbi:MAG TPA: tetratricopeptide repeat protein, partial [Vicinamibacteria bacterium]|nr:tetratricopeptide repeat protein [Vicinamibacteria bacterium]